MVVMDAIEYLLLDVPKKEAQKPDRIFVRTRVTWVLTKT